MLEKLFRNSYDKYKNYSLCDYIAKDRMAMMGLLDSDVVPPQQMPLEIITGSLQITDKSAQLYFLIKLCLTLGLLTITFKT